LSLTVIVKEPVLEFARLLAPEQRRAVKAALVALRREKGDIKPLEQALTGFYRLRIGKFRLVFRYSSAKTIEAIYLEERSIVYEVFEAQLLAKLLTSSRP
jgi:mRNA interferase RelE/StbE